MQRAAAFQKFMRKMKDMTRARWCADDDREYRFRPKSVNRAGTPARRGREHPGRNAIEEIEKSPPRWLRQLRRAPMSMPRDLKGRTGANMGNDWEESMDENYARFSRLQIDRPRARV